MKLMTKAIEKKLPALTSTSDRPMSEVPVVVKFFTPWGNWSWYAVEGEKQNDGDWLFYGVVEGMEKELCYFTLSQLEEIRGPGWMHGLGVERDRLFSATLDKIHP
jgi:hypothetical protein